MVNKEKGVVCDSRELKKILETKRIAVYGTGFSSKRFSLAMQKYGMEDNITCYINTTFSFSEFLGKKVFEVANYQSCEEEIVCIAVHESIVEEIIETLKHYHIFSYIWITPFLLDLEMGLVEKREITLDINSLVKPWKSYYIYAIRYLVIEEFYGKNDFGYETYIRANTLFSDYSTAKKRLKQFVDLIYRWESIGYDKNHLICIDKNNIIVDGSHRFSLALYHGVQEITCIKYDGEHSDKSIFEKVYVDKEVLSSLGLKQEILDYIENIQERLMTKEV